MTNILIIDDDVQLCKALSMVLESKGYNVSCAYYLAQGQEMVEQGRFDLVILDIRLPDGNGLDALPGIKDSKHHPEVIILSGQGDPDGAELAIRSGAWGYIPKPPALSGIMLPVERAIEYRRHKLTRYAAQTLKRDSIIGESRALKACMAVVAQAAETEANVLITGETGTGKELIARTIHANSARAASPFVVLDCAALTETLVESTLFGHEKGAFTGADRKSDGLIKLAHQGTLFLDEVGEMPMQVQKSFLRVIQEHRFRPVGGAQELDSDFRLIAATNKDLDRRVESWDFREDLLYRIRTLAIHAPPLRDREGDVKRLVDHFLYKSRGNGEGSDITAHTYSRDFLDAFESYSWPGNVRELMHALECAKAAAGDQTVLQARHLPMNIRVHLARNSMSAAPAPDALPMDEQALGAAPTPETFPKLKDYRAKAMDELERQYMLDVISLSRWDIPRACELSGLSRSRLYALLKKYGISHQDYQACEPMMEP